MKLNEEDLSELLKEISELNTEDPSDAFVENEDFDIKNCSSEKLCSLIASNRYLRFSDQMEIDAMKELSERRIKGENFPFETKIVEYGTSFVPLNTNMPDLMKIIPNIKGKI